MTLILIANARTAWLPTITLYFVSLYSGYEDKLELKEEQLCLVQPTMGKTVHTQAFPIRVDKSRCAL